MKTSIMFLVAIGFASVGLIHQVFAQNPYPQERAIGWHSRLTAADSHTGVMDIEAAAKKHKAELDRHKAIEREKYITADPASDGRNLQEGVDPDGDSDGDTDRDSDSDSNADSD